MFDKPTILEGAIAEKDLKHLTKDGIILLCSMSQYLQRQGSPTWNSKQCKCLMEYVLPFHCAKHQYEKRKTLE